MGSAGAAQLVALGAQVILVGRNRQRLSRVADRLPSRASIEVADVSEEAQLDRLLGDTGAVDGIVVAISAGASASSIDATTPRMAKAAFSRFWTSYMVLHRARQVLPKNGSVTLLSGSSARTPAPGFGVWTTLHGSIEALARAAAVDLAPIRVNIVSPGGIGITPDRQLVERLGQPEDVGSAIALAVMNRAMTGAVIDIDSGERKGQWSGDDPAHG